MIVVDTGFIYALADESDKHHREAVLWYQRANPELATTPLVVAEADHLIGARLGSRAKTGWRADLAAGAYVVSWWPTALSDIVEVAENYADLGAGLTDASLVALAHRMGTVDVAGFDVRHFRVMRPISGGDAFRLLPADADTPASPF